METTNPPLLLIPKLVENSETISGFSDGNGYGGGGDGDGYGYGYGYGDGNGNGYG